MEEERENFELPQEQEQEEFMEETPETTGGNSSVGGFFSFLGRTTVN